MSDTVRIVRVFLASPGDLGEERQLANEAVKEINKQIGPYLGFNVELKGWEDTLSGRGRPQEIINQELDVCELFIGMMWKKWGTSPSKEGPFTSGFEEEYTRSIEKSEKESTPEIAVYFKDVDQELLNDPGDDLKKVLDFKSRLIKEKKILFQNFSQPADLQQLVRLKIQNYLLSLKTQESENEEDEKSQTKSTNTKTDYSEGDVAQSLLSAEGHRFLEGLLEKTKSPEREEEISQLDIARLRLLSNTLTGPGNDNPRLGAHDANILFRNRLVPYGDKEISRLFDAGLISIQHENTPLWHWYSTYQSSVSENGLQFKSLSEENIATGALEAMRIIGASLPCDGKGLNRKLFIDDWLHENSADDIKASALRYLKYHGKDEDLDDVQKELDRANSKTTKIALEAKIAIQLRYNKAGALNTVFTHPFETIDKTLLNKVLSLPQFVKDDFLRLGLKHRNKYVRLECLDRLDDNKSLKQGDLQQLYDDTSAQVRKKAVELTLQSGGSLSNKEIKSILVKPSGRAPGIAGLFGGSMQSDEEGESCYQGLLLAQYLKMSEKELLEKVGDDWVFNDIPYFALCEKYFKKHADELRRSVDDQFREHFEKHIKYLEGIGLKDEIIQKTRKLEDFIRKNLTREGLDVLSRKSQATDLERVRINLQSGYVQSSYDEIEYMRKHGDWEDIPLIIKLERDYTSRHNALTILTTDDNWSKYVGSAIYNIGKDRLDDLLNLEIPFNVLVEVIKEAAPARFMEISHQTLLRLLNNEHDKIRKYVSLKIIQAMNKHKIKTLLNEYVEDQEYRYYNVIFWLDFGVSVPKKTVNSSVNLILKDGY